MTVASFAQVETSTPSNLGVVSRRIHSLRIRQLIETAELRGFNIQAILQKNGGREICQHKTVINGHVCQLYSLEKAFVHPDRPKNIYARLLILASSVGKEVGFVLVNISVRGFPRMELVVPAEEIRKTSKRGDTRPWHEVYRKKDFYVPLQGDYSGRGEGPSLRMLDYVDRWDLLEINK